MAKDLQSILARQRKAAIKADGVALDQIVSVYQKSYSRIEQSLEVSLRRMVGKDLSRQQIAKGLKDFEDTTATELEAFASWLAVSVVAWGTNAATIGGQHSIETLKALSGLKTVNAIDFAALPNDTVEQMLTFLADGSPLFQRIEAMSPFYAEAIRDKMIESIALGLNPRTTAEKIEPFITGILNDAKSAFASPLADALRTTRTAQLWSYREASRNNYLANSEIVTGWQWSTSKDTDVCASCLAMDGTVHSLDEVLDDHYNGRCSMIPVILGQPALPETSGRDYFDSLSEEEQRGILGAAKFEAFQEGKFEFSALSTQQSNDVFGTMRFETSLKDLIGSE